MSQNIDEIFQDAIDSVVNDAALYQASERYHHYRNTLEVSECAKDLLKRHLNNVIAQNPNALTSDEQSALLAMATENSDQLIEALNDTGDYGTCEVTAALLHIDHVVTVENGNGTSYVVSETLNTYDCNDCGQTFLHPYQHVSVASVRQICNSPHDTNNGPVCSGCFDDHYFSCYGCGSAYHTDDSRFHEGDDAYYCESCFPNGLEPMDNSLILPRAAGSYKDGLAVGWEIECYPSDGADQPSHKHVERIYLDGSLGREGREITTQPALPEQWEERLRGIEIAIDGASVESDCGGHLHVDARYLHFILWADFIDRERLTRENKYLSEAICNISYMRNYLNISEYHTLTERYRKNLDLIDKSANSEPLINKVYPLIVYYQNALRLLCTSERNDNTYCIAQTVAGLSYDKYRAINLGGLSQNAERNTMEFRLWDGSIDTEALYRRAEVCEAIVRKITEIAEMLAIGDKQTGMNFVSEKLAHSLQTKEGFWSVFDNERDSTECIEHLANELGLSDEWRQWAKQTVVARRPRYANAA